MVVENYKHLYEQTKKMLEKYQDEIVPGFRKSIEALERYRVEVVRCRDCIWWNKAGCAIYIVDDTDKPNADDFCSFGERKTT